MFEGIWFTLGPGARGRALKPRLKPVLLVEGQTQRSSLYNPCIVARASFYYKFVMATQRDVAERLAVGVTL